MKRSESRGARRSGFARALQGLRGPLAASLSATDPVGMLLRAQALLLGLALVPLVLLLLLALVMRLFGAHTANLDLWIVLLLVLGVAAGVAAWISGRLFGRRILEPVLRTSRAVTRLGAGDFNARAGVRGPWPFERLGEEFDALMEDRIMALERIARESEELNDSVIEIMQAVGTIATRKDLTLRVPVTENVTGAIADALNLLTEETRRVLAGVRSVSHNVAEATVAVKGQSDSAGKAAAREQREVALAAQELAAAADALAMIAARARVGGQAAERAATAAEQAMDAVAQTGEGVRQSRELIRETEKRIKRLGERSQEIGQAVDMIQSIAERTGILALNASMHAAGAGEAGRRFGVLADEVKRLSESAREAAQEVGRLVGAIQAETGETAAAMNHAITQVVEISRLAELSGEAMRRSHEENGSMVADVRDIARTAAEQARVGLALQERARIIQEASSETARQLSLQASETHRLVQSARSLLDEVAAFKVGET